VTLKRQVKCCQSVTVGLYTTSETFLPISLGEVSLNRFNFVDTILKVSGPDARTIFQQWADIELDVDGTQTHAHGTVTVHFHRHKMKRCKVAGQGHSWSVVDMLFTYAGIKMTCVTHIG